MNKSERKVFTGDIASRLRGLVKSRPKCSTGLTERTNSRIESDASVYRINTLEKHHPAMSIAATQSSKFNLLGFLRLQSEAEDTAQEETPFSEKVDADWSYVDQICGSQARTRSEREV